MTPSSGSRSWERRSSTAGSPTRVARRGAPESRPGSYALVLRADRAGRLRAGRLGWLVVRPGTYLYVGSALGPGGVRARVQHHLRRSHAPHWHIDHLRRVTRLDEVWCSYGEERREHAWAGLLSAARGASIPLPGFGASDCACPSHLFFFASPPSLQAFRRRVRRSLPGHGGIESLGPGDAI